MGLSDAPFSIVNPAIEVTAPNKAVTWRAGDSHNITFSHNLGVGQPVDIDVSCDGGTTWSRIGPFTTTREASNKYSWVVTAPATSRARIRVTWTRDATVSDMSDVDFTIRDSLSATATNTPVSWRMTCRVLRRR